MRVHGVTALGAAAVVFAAATPAADGKFKLSLALAPKPPIAGQTARVTIQTDVVLPRRQRLSLIAVGPWRAATGQAIVDVRLRRVGPRAFRASVRFSYAGRWHVQLVDSAVPPNGWYVRVRSRAPAARGAG